MKDGTADESTGEASPAGTGIRLGARVDALLDRSDAALARLFRLPRPLAFVGRTGERFTSRLHDRGVAARLGIALGVSFGICFLTGLYSHVLQHPPFGLPIPAAPAQLYRVTQGLHVLTGIASLPLLLAKLWTIFPRLFAWPPVRSTGHGLERAFVLVLVAGSSFQVALGLVNVADWYPFPFNFTTTHYAVAWALIGAVVVHLVHKRADAARELRRPLRDAPDAPAAPGASLGRRQFLATVAATSGLLVVLSAGQTVPWLRRVGLFATHVAGIGPQGVPVRKTARQAGIGGRGHADAYRLRVTGAVARELEFTLDELRALPQATSRLPITCVEGWSATATWSGVRLRDLLDRAGAGRAATVLVGSLQTGGAYHQSYVDPPHARSAATLLALRLNGRPLADDHGFPCRLIAPNRPGVLQTKWVTTIEVLS